MTSYYNEIDKNAAAWLRNLIAAGHIAPGIVDERSIEDVVPTELMGFTQCHFFAGVGIWPLALRNAGWPDARPVWTGSCPCQPFSSAGKGAGFIDERHLWPTFQHLISQCRPELVFGEQVASKDADPWIDLVHTDLEALGYAFGAVAFPSAGVGAPHIRDRTYWVADAQQHHRGSQTEPADHGQPQGGRPADWAGGCGVSPGGMADANHQRRDGLDALLQRQEPGRDAQDCTEAARGGAAGELGDASGTGLERHAGHGGAARRQGQGGSVAASGVSGGLADNLMQQRPDWKPGICNVNDESGRIESSATPSGLCSDMRPGPVNGFWRPADWLGCRDGEWRPVEPGTSPLVNGLPRSMGQMPPELVRLAKMAGLDSKSLARAKSYRIAGLKGYGNALNAKAAQAFVEAVME